MTVTTKDFKEAAKLTNILNMNHVMSGGLNTEYSLYIIKAALKAKCIKELDDGIRHFELIYDGILLEILEELATRNLTVISKEVDNVGIIVDLIYEILNIIVRQHPYLLGKAKRIVDFLELNNEWLVTEPSDYSPARTEFNKTLQLYTDAEKIKQMHQQRS